MKYRVLSSTFAFLAMIALPAHADDWVFPVGTPNENQMRVTQDFMNYLTEGSGYHTGLDVGEGVVGNRNITPNRRTVRAVAQGRVIYTNNSGYNGGFGNTVVIRHQFLSSDRYIFSAYNHLADNTISVRENEVVQPGQPIGTMGNTGNADGVHLHLSLFNKGNGFDDLSNFDVSDLRTAYASNQSSPSRDTDTGVVFYDPLLYLKFARLAAIAPVSVRSYSINGDAQSGSPSALRVGTNTVEIVVSTYRSSADLSLSVRDYTSSTFGGDMSLESRTQSTWIMSEGYDDLGREIPTTRTSNDFGWNREYELRYQISFDLPSGGASEANIAIFYKPDSYNSSALILPIPGGNAYNTITRSGRYVTRPVN